MNWYRLTKLQQSIDLQDEYTNYGHKLTDDYSNKLPEESFDEMWIWSGGNFQRQRVTRALSRHDIAWPEIDEGRANENIRFWKGRFDSKRKIVTVLGPMEQGMRDIPSIIRRTLEQSYPGAEIKRFQ